MAILVPLLASPLPVLYPDPVGKCGYCVIVIGFYWVTEIVPLAVTSLLPIFLFPVFGVMSAKAVCMAYAKDTLMLFLGSLVVAVAVEKWNLHKRLALRTLTLVGPEPKWLLLGVMLPTWFLSMWMSNTATTAMMMPIVSAILGQIKECQMGGDDEEEEAMIVDAEQPLDLTIKVEVDEENHKEKNGNIREKEKLTLGEDDGESPTKNRESKEKEFLALARTFSLATAFSANIGGMATLTGTPPNVIFKGLADGLYKQYGAKNPINFANWLALGVPIAIVLIVVLWLWMQMYSQGVGCLMFWRKDKTSYEKVRSVLRREYNNLGPMSFAEILVTINFVLLALLWVTRRPGFIPGWSEFFLPGYVGDSTPAIMIAVLLFILPARPPAWMVCCRSKSLAVAEHLESLPSYEPILDWATVNKRMAWGVLLLMGGGFALADGCQLSGLSAWVSMHLEGLNFLPDWAVCMLLTLIVAAITEVTSNAATTTLFVPIVGDLAVRMGVNPLYFMIPCTIAASLAFLLPVATPPNAIVFASGYLRVKDMVLAGLPINTIAIIFLNLAVNSWVSSVYDMHKLPFAFHPDVFNSTLNATAATTINSTFINTTVLPPVTLP